MSKPDEKKVPLTKKSLKLDFNERSDSKPNWLNYAAQDESELWQYPDKSSLQKVMTLKIGIKSSQILLTNGGDEAIELMFKLAKLNDYKLILPLPAFSQYLSGYQIWDTETVLVKPKTDMRIDLDAVIEKIQSNSIVILTSPNNPTGEVIPKNRLDKVCRKAQQKGAFIFLDEAYIEFTQDSQSTLDLIAKYDNLIVLRTLSKAYGLAGIRVGYILGQAALIEQFRKISMPFNVSQPNLNLAAQAFTNRAKLEVIQYCKKISENRVLVYDFLTKKGLNIVESGANFLFVYGNKNKIELIKAAARQRNIIIKAQLQGIEEFLNKQVAIRLTIPFYLDDLMSCLRFALEPELICFDMDGVLIDVSKSYDQSITKTVKYFTKKTINPEVIYEVRSRGGFNNDWILSKKIIEEIGFDIELKIIVEKFQQFYQGNDQQKGLYQLEKAILNPIIANQLFVNKAKSLKTAIVTGRPKQEAKAGVVLLGVKNTLVISDDDVELSKPDPEGINKAKAYFKKENTWMVGDAPDDMLAAKSAGCIAIGIATGFAKEALYMAGADIVLNSVNDLGGMYD